MKFFKFLLKLIPLLVIAVTVPRVADFMASLGADSITSNVTGGVFAILLALGVLTTSYFSNEQDPPEYEDEPTSPKEVKRRQRELAYFATMKNAVPAARTSVLMFGFLDGVFNLAEVFKNTLESGRLNVDQNGVIFVGVYGGAVFLYGVSPTIISFVLARLISMVDRIPEDYERPQKLDNRPAIDWSRAVFNWIGLDDSVKLSPVKAGESENENGRTRHSFESEGKREVLWEYINRVYQNEQRLPGPTEVSQATNISIGYAHRILNEYKNSLPMEVTNE